MTDAQFGALLTTLIGVGSALSLTIRWAVGRITKAWDDQTASNLRLAESQLAAAAKDAEMRATMMHGMQTMQDGLSQILQFLFTGRNTGTFKTVDEEPEIDRPGAERRRQARTPLQIPRMRPQHNDDNE